jgi:hypothetical protein
MDSSFILTCQNPAFKSKFEKYLHRVNYTVGPSVSIYAKQEKVLAVVCYSWFPGGMDKLNNIFCSIKEI